MLDATLSLAEAARRWPVVVVGAGPAGALAAAEVARRGVAVLLVERAAFPRAKVCGGCLNGRGLRALADAGLADLPWRVGGVRLAMFHLSVGGATARLPLPAGVALSRAALDAALVRAAIDRGAAFLPETRATLRPAAGWRTLALRRGTNEVEVTAAVVLAADGLGGTLLPAAGVESVTEPGSRIGAGALFASPEPFYQPGTVYMTCGRDGYFGLTRVEDGRLDVACAVDPMASRRAGGPGPVVERLLRDGGFVVPEGLRQAAWRGTPALTRQARRVAGHRLFALGDATGYVEPFTGEGMAWALAAAVAVADLACAAARDWEPRYAAMWARHHRRLVTRRQGVCRAASVALRHPTVARWVARVVSYAPALAAPVVGYLNAGTAPSREDR